MDKRTTEEPASTLSRIAGFLYQTLTDPQLFKSRNETSQSKTPPSPPSSDPYTSECTAMRQEPQERLEKLHEDRAGISERINEVFRGTSQSKTPPPSPDPYTSECTAMRQELQERLEKLHEDMAGISARINEVFRGTSQSKTPPPSPDPYSSECTTMRQESQERLEKVHEHRAGISERINQVFRGTSQSKTPPPPPSPDPNTSECTTMLQESQERLEKLHEDRAGISERINQVFRGTSQSKTPPPLPSPDPYTSERMTMRQELQERLEKLHEDRAVISESINQVFRGVDMIVEYVNSLTDMSEFYSGFVAACAAMEQLSIKLFRIGLLLNRENNLIGASQQQRSSEGATVNDGSVDQFSGATQQRPPDATVTSPGSSDVSEEATVIDGGKDLLSGANQQKSPDVTRTSPSSCDDFKEETIIDGGKDLPSSVNQQKSPDVTITSPSSCDDFKKETIIDGGKDLPSGVNEQKSPDVTRTSFSSCDNSEDASMIDGGKDLYSDANQQKSPDVTITFPSSSEDSDGSEEGTLIYGEDLHSISRDDVEKPQNTSEASPQHVSVCEEITTSAAASFVRLQRNIPSVLPPDRAASRGASSKIVGIASKMPVVIAHRRITPRAKADVVGVPVPVKQRPSARPISVTGFDQYCREQRERNKVSEIVSSAAQSRVAVTAAIFVQSQSGQTEAPGGDTSSFTASQEALNPSTSLVRRSAAGRELSILEYDEIPLYYPDIIRTTQDVVLSFYKNPAEFWLQLATSAQQLETFARELHEHYSCVAAQRQGFTARPGMSCAAFYTEDGRWYRAKIVGVFQGYVVVYYVDFGNTDTVDLNNLCPLDRQFASLPEQALYCGIKGLKVPWGSQTFSLEAMRSFRERISARNIKLQAFFHARELNTHYLVDIVARPVEEAVMNLSQEFLGLCIEEGSQLIHTSQDNENFMRTCDPFFGRKALESSIATPPSGVHSMPPVVPLSSMPTTVSTASATVPPAVVPEGNSFHVMLSVVYSPTDFYVQIIDHANTTAKVLEELQHHLNMHSIQTLPPSDPAVTRGSFWACFYEEDRNWYRVQVLDVLLTANHAKRFRVLCVDYGNRITVSSTYLRSLPYSLSGLPACAHRLALAHVAPRDGLMWDAVATGTFVRATGFKDVYFAEKKGERTISITPLSLLSPFPSINNTDERNVSSDREALSSVPDDFERRACDLHTTCLENVIDVVLWKKTEMVTVNINALLLEKAVAVMKP